MIHITHWWLLNANGCWSENWILTMTHSSRSGLSGTVGSTSEAQYEGRGFNSHFKQIFALTLKLLTLKLLIDYIYIYIYIYIVEKLWCWLKSKGKKVCIFKINKWSRFLSKCITRLFSFFYIFYYSLVLFCNMFRLLKVSSGD